MPRKRRKSMCQKSKYSWKKVKISEDKPNDSLLLLPSKDLLADCSAETLFYDDRENSADTCIDDKVNSETQTLTSVMFTSGTQTLTSLTYSRESQTEHISQTSTAETQTGSQISPKTELPFEILGNSLKDTLQSPYCVSTSDKDITVLELYPSVSSIKLSLIIDRNFTVKLFVHRKEVSPIHEIWNGLPQTFNSLESVQQLLARLSLFYVCVGNPDEEYQEITPIGCGVSDGFTNQIRCYREGDFGAVKGHLKYSSTIRSVHCSFLVKGSRCSFCAEERRMLRKRHQRAAEKKTGPHINLVHSNMQHKHMSRDHLITKIKQQSVEMKSMAAEINQLKKQIHKSIAEEGHELDELQSNDIKDLVSVCQNDIIKTFPDPNSLQRLFWEQQMKYAAGTSKNAMRWHPMIIRWCLYMRSKSSKAYDSMRDSGFIKLPSSRTLFDYTHYTKSALGFQPDVVKMLRDEAEKTGMHEETHKRYVGVLFDEIRIKEDLVYDKNSGELIGYCNLDSIGNQFMNLEKQFTNQSSLAKFMLIIMVRGVTTSLKFPLAGFATESITADFLYPIIWKTISLMESVLELKVLFCTCDGASANRKFFQLHKIDDNPDPVYYTENPHDNSRNLYFISDVPHLLKTTRNCFSNSYSHKKTRKLWNNGKDISWMQIVRLFEEHCEMQIYTPCPKLTRSHVDLTAFSYMKVNLAAEILSSTVANALELYYDDSVQETVKFIRIFNKLFDCLNVRSLFEGRNKRNPDLNPYTSNDDERLIWLTNDFLNYLSDWKESVNNRGNLYYM